LPHYSIARESELGLVEGEKQNGHNSLGSRAMGANRVQNDRKGEAVLFR
jgi:hypothetical protein